MKASDWGFANYAIGASNVFVYGFIAYQKHSLLWLGISILWLVVAVYWNLGARAHLKEGN